MYILMWSRNHLGEMVEKFPQQRVRIEEIVKIDLPDPLKVWNSVKQKVGFGFAKDAFMLTHGAATTEFLQVQRCSLQVVSRSVGAANRISTLLAHVSFYAQLWFAPGQDCIGLDRPGPPQKIFLIAAAAPK